MYCKNCGKEIKEEYNVCPYCSTKLNENINAQNQQTKKFIPYYKRDEYKKHPILDIIATIAIILGIIVLIKAASDTKQWQKDYWGMNQGERCEI